MPREQKALFVGTNRVVAALDPRTGAELWRTKLPKGTVGSPPTILIKGRSLYVGCYGYVYCLDKRSGEILWDNGLPRMGFHAVLLAMEGAEGGTSQHAALTDHRLRQQKAAAAAASGA